MATCSQEIYPPVVIQSVTKQIEAYEKKNGSSSVAKIPSSMEVKPCMRAAKLQDAVMVELQIEKADSDDDSTDAEDGTDNNSNNIKPDADGVASSSILVKEVDVLRGREVIQRNSGLYGSICFVIRRPG